MSEVLLPPWIIPEKESHEWVDEGSSVFRSAFAPGLAQRQSYGGLRLKISRTHTVRDEEKAQLFSILEATRGQYNALRTKVHFATRGSGLGSELLTNGTFQNGTTGWTTSSTQFQISESERILRIERISPPSADSMLYASAAVTTTAYAPYALRYAIYTGRGYFVLGHRPGYHNILNIGALSTSNGLFTGAATRAETSSLVPAISCSDTSGVIAGHFFMVPYMSMSRCALIDTAPNLLERSEEFDNAYWTKVAVTVIANDSPDPVGTITGENIQETTANSGHYIERALTVAASAQDYSFSILLKASGRSHCWLQMTEGGGTSVTQFFELTTGAAGTASTGAGWSDLRVFSRYFGANWWQFCVVARKTTSSTSLTIRAGSATSDGVQTYVGNASISMHYWRATLAQSSVPTLLSQTTTASTSGVAPTGNGFNLKGLPTSTNGILLPGDWFEINGELKQATASLNSDELGLGYLQFEPPLVRSPADNDPVILTNPMGKFLVSNIKIDNEFGTQARVSYDLEHIYE